MIDLLTEQVAQVAAALLIYLPSILASDWPAGHPLPYLIITSRTTMNQAMFCHLIF